MKLFYLDFPNVGDQLNPWLWSRLLPNVLDQDPGVSFIGIGTLLNRKIYSRTPSARHRIVFGTGVGYIRTGVPSLDESWTVYCVRGPLSAKALSLSNYYSVTDPGVLVQSLCRRENKKNYRFSYMPHVDQAELADASWREICARLGFGYIDPRLSVESVLALIDQTEIVLTEAMHGSVFADSLRVPWIPVVTSGGIERFKWEDWCASIHVPYSPVSVALPSSLTGRLLANILGVYPKAGRWPKKSLIRDTGAHEIERSSELRLVANRLAQIAKTTSPVLSNDSLMERLVTELDERIAAFRDEALGGKFSTGQMCL